MISGLLRRRGIALVDSADIETSCYKHSNRSTAVQCTRCDNYICPDCMREAPVGFRCPDCVKAENKTVRQGRTLFGGKPVHTPWATYTLILLNVLAYLAELVDPKLIDRFDVIGFTLRGPDGAYYVADGVRHAGFDPGGVAHGEWWRLVTGAVLHQPPGSSGIGLTHILFNMIWLWTLGRVLEDRLGRLRFLAIFFIGALGSSVMVVVLDPTGGAIGESGAGFALVAAYYILSRRMHELPLDPRQLIIGTLLWLVLSAGFASWQGHLGGLLAGGAAALGIVFAPRVRRTAWQVAALGGVTLVWVTLLVAFANLSDLAS
jgi:membrane associated rhomboid family serine protease